MSKMDGFEMDGFFTETSMLWPGQAFSLKVKKELFHQQSDYQDVKVVESENYGKVLVLDGIIQITERDEFSYSEMIAHLPLFCHPAPKKVLVIGGGDGGAIREAVKHPEVEEVHICEIDGMVIDVIKRFLPGMATGYYSPKVSIHVEDGVKYIEKHTGEFDVIITDASDPIGPAVPLFEKPYYEKVFSALKEDGVLCCQGDCYWLDPERVSGCVESAKQLFPVVDYAHSHIPSYPSGHNGYLLASKNKNSQLRRPCRVLTEKQVEEWNLKYYNSEVHGASFVLPQFARKIVNI